jgi:hypothetical protein
LKPAHTQALAKIETTKSFQRSVAFDRERRPIAGRCRGRRFAMLMFYLPIIIFEAMLSAPKRASERSTDEKIVDHAHHRPGS